MTPEAPEELLPCPFCGHKPVVRQRNAISLDPHRYQVQCGECACGTTDRFDRPERAATVWNRRTQASRQSPPDADKEDISLTEAVARLRAIPTEYTDDALAELHEIRHGPDADTEALCREAERLSIVLRQLALCATYWWEPATSARMLDRLIAALRSSTPPASKASK